IALWILALRRVVTGLAVQQHPVRFILANAISWGIVGALGGLAVQRGWGSSANRGVVKALLMAAVLGWIVEYSVLPDHHLTPGLGRWMLADVFRCLGWAGGILIYGPAADAVFRRPLGRR